MEATDEAKKQKTQKKGVRSSSASATEVEITVPVPSAHAASGLFAD